MERQLFRGVTPRVFSTNPGNPEEARVFVWARTTRWYERQEGESGAVAFPRVADSEEELRGWVRRELGAELTEIDDEFAGMVREEFLEQTPLYPEGELSDDAPFDEQEIH